MLGAEKVTLRIQPMSVNAVFGGNANLKKPQKHLMLWITLKI